MEETRIEFEIAQKSVIGQVSLDHFIGMVTDIHTVLNTSLHNTQIQM